MSKLVRFSVCLDKNLVEEFDQHIESKNYSNRSDAFRDLMRKAIIEKSLNKDVKTAGTIIISYDHHKRELLNKLVNVEHDYEDVIISTQHIHINHDSCMEMIALRGSSKRMIELSNKIRNIKGIKNTEICFVVI
ncbi:MAG: nickel-responsive transcriptional regulator NikR [Oligoflexia bacterium]|nr:nickel-responsive transcriptional regulator NikR [Oligoflexia bacterium]